MGPISHVVQYVISGVLIEQELLLLPLSRDPVILRTLLRENCGHLHSVPRTGRQNPDRKKGAVDAFIANWNCSFV